MFLVPKMNNTMAIMAMGSIMILSGIHSILLINSIISFSFSIFYITKNESKIESYIIIPVLLSKFYFFTFNYICTTISEEKKGYEFLMSPSTLISIYLLIWNFILDKLILNNIANDYILFIIQIIVCAIIIICFLFYFLINCFYSKYSFCLKRYNDCYKDPDDLELQLSSISSLQ